MKKLILITLILFPHFLSAQAVVSHADSIAMTNKLKDSIVKNDKDDIEFLKNLPPRSNTLVTDYTQTLSPKDVLVLENKLVAFNDLTGAQIAVVILQSVGNFDIMQYGRRLANSWGIGRKGKKQWSFSFSCP